MAPTELKRLWESRIADQRSSGLSVSKWCETHQMKIHQFYYWSRKLTNVAPATPQWIEVNVDPQPADERQSTLLLKVGSVEIEVKPGFNQPLLSDVIRTLQTLC